MQSILHSVIFNLKYFSFWVLYFVIARLCFLLYHFESTATLEIAEILNVIVYGFRLDLSIAGYLSVIPFLLIFLGAFITNKFIRIIHKAYSYGVIPLLNILLIVDLFLYTYWNIRLDTSFLRYLNTPELMFASVSTFEIILFIFLILATSLISFRLINLFVYSKEKEIKVSLLGSNVLLFCLGLLILPIRGGLQTIPINQSNVYFSKKMFANHAAINYGWNFIHALSKRVDSKDNPFMSFTPEVGSAIYSSLIHDLKTKDSFKNPLLKSEKPNIILIIWEGFTAKIVEPLGGDHNITPYFNQLTKEGILFRNFYANGDRTDKGLVALLSGYYPQPKKSIIKMPSKSKKLPLLSQEMKSLGYTNSFYHGGDLNFGNMKTYLTGKGIDQIYGSEIFESKDWNSKWGVHDHVLFNRIVSDLKDESQFPFFKTILTLTSHEPYEFPGVYKFGNDSELNKFKSSMSYTDKSVYDFVEFAKKQSWWDNTLIVITGDHGHHLPKTPEKIFNNPRRFQIPMLWIGGALASKGIYNDNIGSQVDLAFTLLDLLNGDNSNFKYSTHLFNSKENRFAHYVFNQGFGTINNSGYIVYDFISDAVVESNVESKEQLKNTGKAILQTTYQDFLEK